MSAETGNEPDSPESPKRHRGRIPQAAWPQILQRHRAGVTLSAIAREFECTPSAISYIVRKAESAGLEPDESEPQAEAREAPPAPPRPVAIQPPAQPAAQPPAQPLAHTSGTTLSLPDRSGGPLRNAPPPAAAPPTVAQVPAPSAPAETARPADGTARPSQPPPVDATEARLRETARACLVSYRGWRTGPGETSIQTLNDAVHELRKVLARIEIDMSASRRDEQGQRPIPVPAHRAARPR